MTLVVPFCNLVPWHLAGVWPQEERGRLESQRSVKRKQFSFSQACAHAVRATLDETVLVLCTLVLKESMDDGKAVTERDGLIMSSAKVFKCSEE